VEQSGGSSRQGSGFGFETLRAVHNS